MQSIGRASPHHHGQLPHTRMQQPQQTAALHTASVSPDEPSSSRSIGMIMVAEIQPNPTASESSERSVQAHSSCGAHVPSCTPEGWQKANALSTVGSPATWIHGMVSVLAAHAVAADRSGLRSM